MRKAKGLPQERARSGRHHVQLVCRLLICLLLLSVPASAQVLQLSAGRSTLLGGSGGEITAYLPVSTITASAGFADGHFVFGGSDTFKFHGLDVTAGDKNFGYSFDGAGLGVSTRGLFVQRNSEHTSIAGFVGSTGIGYGAPFMNTATAQHVGVGFFLQHHFENGLLFSSLAVVDGGRRTAVQGLAYQSHVFRVSGSGGLLQNQKYFSGEVDYQPLRSLSFSATHNDYFLSDHLTAKSLSAFSAFGRVTLQASVLEGQDKTLKTTGASAGAGLRIGSTTVRSNFYESNHHTMLVHTVQERFRRWTVTGIINQMHGQTTYAFGGGYHGNKLSVSVDHSVLFFPLGGMGFQQTTSVQVSLRIHDTVVNFGSTVDPSMHMKYTTYASTYAQGPLAGLVTEKHSYSTHGKFVITGTVVDEHGQPVEGAAIQLAGGAVVYSDSQGKFFARVKHNRAIVLNVLVNEFAAPGHWAVTSCTVNGQPGIDAVIRLKRKGTQ
jgi:hypothetical protein